MKIKDGKKIYGDKGFLTFLFNFGYYIYQVNASQFQDEWVQVQARQLYLFFIPSHDSLLLR